jgi:endoglycosylceramidase
MLMFRQALPEASFILALALASCGGSANHRPAATDTPTTTRTPVATATATALDTATSTEHPTASHTASPTPSSIPTASSTPTPTENLLRVPALHAEPDAAAGGRIVDAEGRHVLLRGVNVNGLAEYWQGGEFPTVFPFTAADADLMAGIGWNAVRLLLSWSRVEPQPGVYDDAYLERAAAAVRLLASRGLYAIIDLHQDAWGPTLAARPDEVCPERFELALGWDGAPGWATFDDGKPHCAQAGVRELSPAVLAAFANFFENDSGPGAIGILDRYAAMLGHVARVLSAEAGVAGYDLMNEPNAFFPEQQAALSGLYATAVQTIRAAETAAGSPPRLILFEPSALWSLLGRGAPPDFARDRDVLYAPHVYTGGFDGKPITAAAFAVARDEAAGFGGAPVLSGEWGADPRRASDPADPYFLDHQNLQDQFLFSATLWTWRESCGDPHKQADFRAGRVPYVWGEFEVDCTSNAVTGLRRDLIDQLTRAYVRAAPGRLLETRYDHATGAFSAHGVGAAPGAELLAFYPASRHGEPTLTTSGLDDVRSALAPGDNLYIAARASGGDWSLTTSLDPAPNAAPQAVP